MVDYDVIIIGSGPAGLFAADELMTNNDKLHIAIFEKNSISSGGLINDCKLNLSSHIGMDLEELKLSEKKANELIKKIDKKFLDLGAGNYLYGTNEKQIKLWVTRAKWAGIKFIAAKQRHVGTDIALKLAKNFLLSLKKRCVTFFLNTYIEDIKDKDGIFYVYSSKGSFTSNYLVIAPGRSGAYWLRSIAKKLGFNYSYGPIDVGVRIEVKNEVMEQLCKSVYDPKFVIQTPTYKDRTRTFCTNPEGFVRIEHYSDFYLVNGDALKNKKSENTNLAILNTIDLTEPYADTTEMGRNIAIETNRLGGGRILAQRMGDFLSGRRSKLSSFFDSSKGYDIVKPTLPMTLFTPGDITLAYRGRIIQNLKESFEMIDKVVPGIMHPSTIIYAPEIKFYDTRYETTKFLETTKSNLFVAGDGAGKSRGIIGAALTGILAARGIIDKI